LVAASIKQGEVASLIARPGIDPDWGGSLQGSVPSGEIHGRLSVRGVHNGSICTNRKRLPLKTGKNRA
jgi:hypothetical protein